MGCTEAPEPDAVEPADERRGGELGAAEEVREEAEAAPGDSGGLAVVVGGACENTDVEPMASVREAGGARRRRGDEEEEATEAEAADGLGRVGSADS